MTPKEKRDRLLKNRPFIRPLNIFEAGDYHKDIAILWTAHKEKPFASVDPQLSQDRFAAEIERISAAFPLLVIEDTNKAFDAGRGPVCLVGSSDDGWSVNPHAEFFPWATTKNILRSTVSFLQWIQYQKIGVCVVRCVEQSKKLCDHCRQYGVLFYGGKIIGGDPSGDEYFYSIMGKNNPKRTKDKANGIS